MSGLWAALRVSIAPLPQQRQPRCQPQQQRRVSAASSRRGQAEVDPYAVLQVARGSGRRAIRAAYIERIKLLHPDVSLSGEKSTADAAAVNAAYDALMAGGCWRHVGQAVGLWGPQGTGPGGACKLA